MVTYAALYRGESLATAQVIAVSSDPDVVCIIAENMLKRSPQVEETGDAITDAVTLGRRNALKIIRGSSDA
jgi:hypothetical protein